MEYTATRSVDIDLRDRDMTGLALPIRDCSGGFERSRVAARWRGTHGGQGGRGAGGQGRGQAKAVPAHSEKVLDEGGVSLRGSSIQLRAKREVPSMGTSRLVYSHLY